MCVWCFPSLKKKTYNKNFCRLITVLLIESIVRYDEIEIREKTSMQIRD